MWLVLFRKMLTKDKKPPEEKGPDKETGQVIPTRPETPKLFKAALLMGKGETFAKLKETYKDSEATLKVLTLSLFFFIFFRTSCPGVLFLNSDQYALTFWDICHNKTDLSLIDSVC